jgi:hypothetical protein
MKIGRAVTVTGHNDHPTGLQCNVCNPTTMVATRLGSLTSFAWSTLTAMMSPDGSAIN